jgi:hypothetical protein
VICADIDKARIVIEVINPIGGDFPKLFKGKVMARHLSRLLFRPVFTAIVLEVLVYDCIKESERLLEHLKEEITGLGYEEYQAKAKQRLTRKKQENLRFKGMEYQEIADTAEVSYGMSMSVMLRPSGKRGEKRKE